MWDYRVEWWHKGRDADATGLAGDLARLGADGWELVTMQKDDSRIASGAFLLVLKRPKPLPSSVNGRAQLDIDEIDFVDLRENN
jgi:hypothetical protein